MVGEIDRVAACSDLENPSGKFASSRRVWEVGIYVCQPYCAVHELRLEAGETLSGVGKLLLDAGAWCSKTRRVLEIDFWSEWMGKGSGGGEAVKSKTLREKSTS